MINQIREFLIKRTDPVFIIVFGSFAKDKTHPKSDIDIAFYSHKTYTSYEIFLIAQELAELLNIEVDLIDLRIASTVFQAQIFSTGIVIYCADETFRMEMHTRVYSMYAKLNEERTPILDQIKERGSVYEK